MILLRDVVVALEHGGREFGVNADDFLTNVKLGINHGGVDLSKKAILAG